MLTGGRAEHASTRADRRRCPLSFFACARNWCIDLHIRHQGHFIGGPGRRKIAFSGRGTCQMSFTVGDTVVYPHHGAARIEAVETRTIKGEERSYLVLKVDKGDLTVRVPADNAELVGVRDVVGQGGLEKVFEVLRAPYTEEPTNWSRRYKANLEKLASGDVNKVAEVVRDLWRRDKERGLSAGEKRMLAKARQILVSELALAEKTNEDKVEALLDEVLANLLRPATSDRPGRRRSPADQFAGAVSGWAVLAG